MLEKSARSVIPKCNGTIQRIPYNVGVSILRFANRNQKGTQGICRLPQETHCRWFHNVPVLDIHKALSKPRKCRCSYQARKDASARSWQCRNPVHHRQAVRQYGNFLRTETGKQQSCGSAIGIVLIPPHHVIPQDRTYTRYGTRSVVMFVCAESPTCISV